MPSLSVSAYRTRIIVSLTILIPCAAGSRLFMLYYTMILLPSHIRTTSGGGVSWSRPSRAPYTGCAALLRPARYARFVQARCSRFRMIHAGISIFMTVSSFQTRALFIIRYGYHCK